MLFLFLQYIQILFQCIFFVFFRFGILFIYVFVLKGVNNLRVKICGLPIFSVL